MAWSDIPLCCGGEDGGVRGLIVAVSLVGLLGSLLGCGPQRKPELKEIVPPKPPHCPDLPEVVNVTLAGGKLADVRILQVDDIKFYVPAAWLQLTDSPRRSLPTDVSSLGLYDPDVHKTECPGVAHKYVSQQMFDLGWRFVVRRSNAEPWILPNFTLETKIDGLSIVRPQAVTNPELMTSNTFEEKIFDWPTSTTPSARIVVVPNHLVAVYRWSKDNPVGSPEWKIARQSVLDFVIWLRTPPKDRDNDRIFELGVAEQ